MHTPGHTSSRARWRGFTLVELMVTLAIVVILATVGVPAMSQFLVTQRAKADADSLAAALRLARTEAVKRSGPVSICPLPANFNPASPACVSTTTTDWSHGWMVFVDHDNSGGEDGAFESDRDTILRVEQNVRSAKAENSQTFKAITFMANGISSSAAGTFTVGPSTNTPNQSLKLTVSRQGRVTQEAWTS
ncbi:GspH/FimT family pseudopilin [Aquabacterium sp.]|uniref:GspH/FimT family pseudopilin n=1 Tax=Aquabacterium sp. TaxID=1872578 RepID=UPI0025B80605|nr:GspH/FimT family pseudopilin [Aquabacterium sp.]